MYVCIYIYIYIYTLGCYCMYQYSSYCECMDLWIYGCMYGCMDVCIRSYVQLYGCLDVWMYETIHDAFAHNILHATHDTHAEVLWGEMYVVPAHYRSLLFILCHPFAAIPSHEVRAFVIHEPFDARSPDRNHPSTNNKARHLHGKKAIALKPFYSYFQYFLNSRSPPVLAT